MNITGKHELERIVVINFTIEKAPTPEKVTIRGLKIATRAIKKDTKKLQRLLSKMERHGWKIKQQEEIEAGDSKQSEGEWYDKGSLSCRCSRCGCKSNKESRYCPNCGSKMKREEVAEK